MQVVRAVRWVLFVGLVFCTGPVEAKTHFALKWRVPAKDVDGTGIQLAVGDRYVFSAGFYGATQLKRQTGNRVRRLIDPDDCERVEGLRAHRGSLLVRCEYEPSEESMVRLRPRGAVKPRGAVELRGTDLHRFRADTGRLVWTRDAILGDFVAKSDRVWVVEQEGLVALDFGSGKVLWRVPAEGPHVHGLAVGESHVFIVEQGAVRAYDAATGKLAWQKPLPEQPLNVHKAVTAGRRNVYLAFSQGRWRPTTGERTVSQLWAMDQATGKIVWRRRFHAWVRDIAAAQDAVVVTADVTALPDEPPNTDGGTLALSAETGKLMWRRALCSPLDTALAVAGSTVMVWQETNREYIHRLHALDLRTGAKLWRLRRPGRGRVSAPVLSKGMLFFTDSRGVYGLRRKGRAAKRRPPQ